MDDLFEKVEIAQRAVDVLSRRDGVDLSPEAAKKRTEGVWLKEDTGIAFEALKAAQKEAVQFHEGVYIKERDAMAAEGLLKPRRSKRN